MFCLLRFPFWSSQNEIANAVKVLWADSNFQLTFNERSSFQLFDCYPDFVKCCIENYPEWGGEGWIPSVSDVTKARLRTSGIVEVLCRCVGTIAGPPV